jgi:hypothetical protein
MKKHTLTIVLLVIGLLLSACGGAKTTAGETPVAIQEIQAGDDEITVEPTYTPYPTHTPLPTATATVVETATEPTAVEDAMATDLPAESTAAATVPANTPTATPAQALPVSASGARSVELTRIPDSDPAPPLTILVSKIQIAQNGYYKLTGIVRNDGTETYGGVGIVATFYEQENACSQRQVTRRAPDGSEQTVTVEDCDYNWHGPVEVYAACQLLEPGAQCPFSLQIYPAEYVSYLLHPEGTPVAYRQPVSLALSDVRVSNNGLGYVRVTGTATNANPFTVRDANVAVTLLDADGQIVSVGSILLPGELPPGASVDFDLRIEYAPYVTYQLLVQATQS